MQLARLEPRALGSFATVLQRQKVVSDFEAMLLSGDAAGSKVPFAFHGLF